MSLRGLLDVILGRHKVETAEDDKKFYARLAAVKAVMDASTEQLRADHKELSDKLDNQARRMNELFDELTRDDHR